MTGDPGDTLDREISDTEAVFGLDASDVAAIQLQKRSDFDAWHRPVKQLVREEQWAYLTQKLIAEEQVTDTLRYFTLPGVEMLDIQMLAKACRAYDVKLDYFGFDDSRKSSGNGSSISSNAVILEAELRQDGLTTDSSQIIVGKMQDIARERSHASERLAAQTVFDIVNIDACDHLAYSPQHEGPTLFAALETILRHQIGSTRPWLLFITTRVDSKLLGEPKVKFNEAIIRNLEMRDGHQFAAVLSEALNLDVESIMEDIESCWHGETTAMLKLYIVGLGKHLLHFLHAQVNHPARVELASSFGYRVYGDEPDMLAIAFRIRPAAKRIFPPSTGGSITVPDLEVESALRIARNSQRLRDLDRMLQENPDRRLTAISATRELLAKTHDLAAYDDWINDPGSANAV